MPADSETTSMSVLDMARAGQFDRIHGLFAPGLRTLITGGRDYQATVEDDLARWEAALAGRPGVTIRVFPADNHFFFPGTGPSSPAELEPAQHVDEAVVDEIAGWLGRIGRQTDRTQGVPA